MDFPGKTKIAYFLDAPKGFGGAGNLLLEQARLMEDLYKVVVVIPMDTDGIKNEEYEKRCEKYGLSYIGLKYGTAYNFMDLGYTGAMRSVAEIEEFARKEEITFFHSVQLNLAVEYVSRKLKIPHLMNIYQLQEKEFKICPADIYAKYHLCDSNMYSDLWQRRLNISSRCIRPVALQDEFRKKKTYIKDKIKILMLGAVCERKNQMAAIRAVEACMGSYKMELRIAGDAGSDYAEECISYAVEHTLSENIIFHGFVSDIMPLLEECDCLLCTSVDESFPSSMVEALTYDLTIISTPIAGVPEVFVNNHNAFVSMDFSVSGIGESVRECMECYANGEINRIHQNAEDTWKSNFDRRLVRQQMDSYYKSILADKNFKSVDIILDMKEEICRTEERLSEVDAEGEEWVYTRSLYYMFLNKNLCGKETYIWGAGKLGRVTLSVLERIFPDLKVMAFIDSHKTGEYCKIPIIKPSDVPIREDASYFISLARERSRVIRYLEIRGLELNTQIWCMP
ncbi:hypothetical protein IMSAG249_02371 [Lachnospiraceae bacterium]|jgi:Glycosyltransferase|nr:hypothetical protein IMSAGC009_00678 [Lachnospiraceae bacterium]GFI70542.1 hypothetical protein IMSAG249_02371 [Lachnospiraceae bacterium]